MIKSKFVQALGAQPDYPEIFKIIMSNPDIISLFSAENKLMTDILLPKIKSRENITENTLSYGGLRDTAKLGEGFCKFFADYFSIKDAKPENLLYSNGIALLVEKLSIAFCDPGDTVLLPAPGYHGFKNFLRLSQTKIEYFDIDNLPAKPSHARLLILTNPGNPFGNTIKDPLKVIEWALAVPGLQIIVDEIYALCDKTTNNFVSIGSLKVSDPNRVHIMYGVSHDWGLAGLKFGVLFSRSEEVLNAVRAVSGMYSVAADQIKLVESIFCDIPFRDNYISTLRKRLKENEDAAVKVLKDGGIPFHTYPSSFFITIDFSSKVTSAEQENEICFRLVKEFRVAIVPHTFFESKDFGKFRLSYAYDINNVIEGCNRIVKGYKAIFP